MRPMQGSIPDSGSRCSMEDYLYAQDDFHIAMTDATPDNGPPGPTDDSTDLRIGVYGTLRKGCTNHHYLRDAVLIGTARIEGWEMYSNGFYPYAVRGSGSIKIEIYGASGGSLEDIDRLEGHPRHYSRTKIETPFGSCWLYFLESRPPGCSRVPGGDWTERRQ